MRPVDASRFISDQQSCIEKFDKSVRRARGTQSIRESTHVDIDVFIAEVCESKRDKLVCGGEDLILVDVLVSQGRV